MTKTLNLTFAGFARKDFYVLVDDEPIVIKKGKNGRYSATISTDKEKVNIKIQRFCEYSQKLWWLWGLIYFFTSIFGIFDHRENSRCVAINSEFNFDLTQTEADIFFKSKNSAKADKAIEVSTSLACEEVANEIFVDEVAKKHQKILRAIKILLWIAFAVSIVLIITKSLF